MPQSLLTFPNNGEKVQWLHQRLVRKEKRCHIGLIQPRYSISCSNLCTHVCNHENSHFYLSRCEQAATLHEPIKTVTTILDCFEEVTQYTHGRNSKGGKRETKQKWEQIRIHLEVFKVPWRRKIGVGKVVPSGNCTFELQDVKLFHVNSSPQAAYDCMF